MHLLHKAIQNSINFEYENASGITITGIKLYLNYYLHSHVEQGSIFSYVIFIF